MTFENETPHQAALKILLCGGIAGIVTWASIFPLDMVKTRLQAQTMHDHSFAHTANERQNLLRQPRATLNSFEMAREVYRAEGMGAFYRGLGICSVRAFIVNAVQVGPALDAFALSGNSLKLMCVQWAAYEWLMKSFNNASISVPVADRV